MASNQWLNHLADKLRILSVKSTSANPVGNSGHPTTCSSCAEIVSTLFFNVMNYDLKGDKRDPSSDRFILSKGHAAPILYAVWTLIDDIIANGGKTNLREEGPNQTELVNHLRETGHKFEGHPIPKLDFVDVATGSLGQGLSCAAGMAYMGKYIDKAEYKTYCLLGDGECAEGSVYEAMAFAAHYQLNNLFAIVDVNRLGQSQPTMYEHDMQLLSARWQSFGWETRVIDGHDVAQLLDALKRPSDKPIALLCKTFKGQGFEGIADQEGWHGKPLANPQTFLDVLQAKLPNEVFQMPDISAPKTRVSAGRPKTISVAKSGIPEGTTKMATRKAYGYSLLALNNERVISLDAEVKNSTFAIDYKKVHPDRFVECFIAEQNLVGVAIGMACRDRAVTFASTFAAFFTRAADHIRMGAISLTNANFVGSHCGVSIGPDGPSQMALEDLALFRAIPNSTVLYPSDAISMEKAVQIVANTPGVGYIRTTRDETPVIYKFEQQFEAGKCQVVKKTDSDKVLIIGAGITLYEALKAHEELTAAGINARVVDLFSLKPFDHSGIFEHAKAAGFKVVTVEDHYPEGGIGEAVLSSLAASGQAVKAKCLAVREIPCSGKGGELMDKFGINHRAIVAAVKSLV